MPDKETSRVEAFSDGVFGIALTLLIIEIRLSPLPQDAGDRDLVVALARLWPSYLAFAMSFVTILIMWVNHHGLFTLVRGVSRRLLFANGFLLMVVTFVNFPTAVLAEHVEHTAPHAAAAFYCGTYFLVSVAYNLLFYAALPCIPAALKDDPGSPLPRVRRAYLLGLLVYAAATGVAFVAPYAALALASFLWVMWLTLDYRRKPLRTSGGDGRRATPSG